MNDWSLRSVYARSLAKIAVPTFWWTLAIAGFAALMVFIVKQTEQQLQDLYEGSPLLTRRDYAKLAAGAMPTPTPRS